MIDNDQRYGNTGLQGDINRMLDEFRRADCVIQAVDIGGLRATADAAGGQARVSGQEGLFYMANETGGELFKDANNLGKQLERVLERTSVTYLLTFERSDLKLDGAYHRLRVKAKLPPRRPPLPPHRLLRAAPLQGARPPGEEPPRLGRHRQRGAPARPRHERPRRPLPLQREAGLRAGDHRGAGGASSWTATTARS